MGKRRIGEIYNKPIVEGDKNLVTKNEIHKSELSGGSGSGGSNIEYLDVSNEPYLLNLIGLQSIECKGISDDISIVAPTACVRLLMEHADVKITQLKVDWDVTVIKNIGGQIIKTTVLEGILNEASQDELDNLPRITKEEFYSLN